MLSEWNSDSILCRPPLLPLERVPAIGTPNADSDTLAHLVGPQPLDEEVDALSRPADVSTGRVYLSVKTTE